MHIPAHMRAVFNIIKCVRGRKFGKEEYRIWAVSDLPPFIAEHPTSVLPPTRLVEQVHWAEQGDDDEQAHSHCSFMELPVVCGRQPHGPPLHNVLETCRRAPNPVGVSREASWRVLLLGCKREEDGGRLVNFFQPFPLTLIDFYIILRTLFSQVCIRLLGKEIMVGQLSRLCSH